MMSTNPPPASLDPRLASRLAALLRFAPSPSAFAMAGAAVARAVISNQEDEPAIQGLVDAMVGSLLSVARQASEDDSAALRIQTGLAAAVVGVTRPHVAVGARDAIAHCMGFALAPVRWMDDLDAIGARAMLALALDDAEQAEECALHLEGTAADGIAALIRDWSTARAGSDPDRERACFRRLKAAVTREVVGASDPGLVPLGAWLVSRRADAALAEVRGHGTPVPARRGLGALVRGLYAL